MLFRSLGLLSGRTYLNNADVYNTSVPQSFWVDNQDNLIVSDTSGVSRTQLNNQFIWLVNYEAVPTASSNIVTRLYENIGNTFVPANNNSITNILSLTEYNVGYSENQTLAFVSSNNSLLDNSKWKDVSLSVGSTTKFLTTIHPVVNDLSKIVETNQDKVHTVEASGEIGRAHI